MDTDGTASGSGAQKRRTVPDDDGIIERKIPRRTERDSAEQRVFDRLFGPPPEEMQQEAMEPAPCRTALSAVATSYYWQEASYGEVPARAVRAGTDKDGGPLYVGRAPHAGDLLPAKVAPTHQGAFVSWNCLEHSKFHYEVLVLGAGVAEWVPSSNGEVPDGAVPVGHTTDGETLYVARVQHDGTTTPGKVHQSHSVCYIPYGGREIAYSHYEVLVI
ncbi:natterin-4-like isoform X3 [Schistocerca nitens]|nr:natterin-4-like isoform X3 [Schistocerca nitens]